MVARSPTGYVALTGSEYDAGDIVLASSFDTMIDNHEFYLTEEVMSLSDCCYRFSTTSTSFVDVYRYYTVFRDDCGEFDDGTTHNADFYVRVWSSAPSVNVDLTISSYTSADVLVDSTSKTVSGSTTPAWYGEGAQDFLAVRTNGSTSYIRIRMRAASAGTVYFGGFALYDQEG